MDKSLIVMTSLMMAAILVASGIAYSIVNSDTYDTDEILPAFSSYHELAQFFDRVHQGARNANPFTSDLALGAAEGQLDGVPYSTTNVRVEGIDEADIVKTDGQYIFVSSYDRVSIVRAYPPEEMGNVSAILAEDLLGYEAENTSVWISGIYILQAKIIVVAQVDEFLSFSPESPGIYEGLGLMWRASEPRTIVSVFDLADIEAPEFLFSYGISGFSLTTRMIDDIVYVVSQYYVWKEANDFVLPKFWNGSESTEFQPGNIHYDPGASDSSSYINILAVNLTTADKAYASIVASYTSTIYMSPTSLYLTFQKYNWEVIALDSGVSDLRGAVVASADSNEISTTIYRIGIDGLSFEPSARGDVAGYLLDHFAIDEADGYLRVATTTGWTNQNNSVYVLDEDLEIVGALEDLAPGERIFAARYVGDTLYLVTFRQVDPLFVIDLSDPFDPKVLGELEIPGFSSYLHPVDSTHLLGIGMENSSVKISLFDVSDPMSPSEIGKYLIGDWSGSYALWDYKAVLFDAELQMLVIPVTAYDNESWYWSTASAYVFNVSEERLGLRGTIDHGNGTYIERSLYIGDQLYTISTWMIKSNALSDLSETGSIIYRETPGGYPPTFVDGGGVENASFDR